MHVEVVERILFNFLKLNSLKFSALCITDAFSDLQK